MSLVKSRGDPCRIPPVILAYDNMCNLARLNAARTPLPLPPPLDQMWLKTTKIIDVFHLRNHISEECKRQFSPLLVKHQYPDMTLKWENKLLLGCTTLSTFYVLCLKFITCFICIEWLLDVTNIPVSVIDMVRSQYYQKSRNRIIN